MGTTLGRDSKLLRSQALFAMVPRYGEKTGAKGARGREDSHQSHNARRTTQNQFHNPGAQRRIALQQGVTPGDELGQLGSPVSPRR